MYMFIAKYNIIIYECVRTVANMLAYISRLYTNMTAYIRDPQDIHAIYARAVSVILQDSAAACMSYSHYDYYYYYYYYYYSATTTTAA